MNVEIFLWGWDIPQCVLLIGTWALCVSRAERACAWSSLSGK